MLLLSSFLKSENIALFICALLAPTTMAEVLEMKMRMARSGFVTFLWQV